MTNDQIIHEFKKAAAVLEIIDTKPFRARAYQKAIETIQNLDEELELLVKRQNIDNMPGIGKELTAKIIDLTSVGHSQDLDKLFAMVPPGMFPLLDVPGIGAKKAFRLATEFNLDDAKTALKKIKKHAQQGDIAKLEGFGQKSEKQILENIEKHRPKSSRMVLDQADMIAQKLITFLETVAVVSQVTVMGSLRRRRETIGDIDIGVATSDIKELAQALENWEQVTQVQASGDNLIRVTLVGNRQADIKVSPPERFGSMLQHFTGSKFHNVALRELALKKGLSLSEHGIRSSTSRDIDKKPGEDRTLKEFASEETFYTYLGLQWIPPELRENQGEIESSQKNALPALVELENVKGDFHTHTDYDWVSSHDYGDKVSNLLTMAHNLGYQWLALGDHNLSQKSYSLEAHEAEVRNRSAWIEQQVSSWKQRENRELSVLKTLEVDILVNGELALSQHACKALDFVIVSIHSSFTLNHDQQTARILKALSYPNVKIMGHPTGRLINERASINADWTKIFEYCAENHIAMEVNANPQRLDLPDSLIREALKHKLKLALGSDAHQTAQLELMPYAVANARRGWATAHDILNSMEYNELVKWLKLTSSKI